MTWVKFTTEDRHVMMLSKYELNKNQHNESYALFRSVNEFQSILLTFVI